MLPPSFLSCRVHPFLLAGYVSVQVVVLAVRSCCSGAVGRFYRNLHKVVVFLTAGSKNLFQASWIPSSSGISKHRKPFLKTLFIVILISAMALYLLERNVFRKFFNRLFLCRPFAVKLREVVDDLPCSPALSPGSDLRAFLFCEHKSSVGEFLS